MGEFLLQNGQTMLFIGDSITDCGRRDGAVPYGDGYVSNFREIVLARNPKLKFNIINKGISGNTVDGLRSRWQDDVMRRKFDFLSVKIGINDIHRQLTAQGGFSVEQYAEDFEAILALGMKKKPKLILIDPFYISTDREDGFRASVLDLLARYLRVVDKLAKKYGALHLRTHKMYQELLKQYPPEGFCPEPVHPHHTGHLAIALELYKLLGGKL